MDRKLVAWARTVKTRARLPHPALWLFIDKRLPDPDAAVRGLATLRPPGLAGIVLRAPDAPGRAALAATLVPLCRRAGLAVVVGADAALAHRCHAGLHLPGARAARPVRRRRGVLLTASAHDAREVRRAARAGADLVFITPVFATASHPGAPALGPRRALRLARLLPPGTSALALGGLTAPNARALPPRFTGAGAVGALAPGPAGKLPPSSAASRASVGRTIPRPSRPPA